MKISVSMDLEHATNLWRLMVNDGKMKGSPAGPRLFRAQPWPKIEFEHTTKAAAEADAKTLQNYLDNLPKPKPRGQERADAFSE